MANQPTITIFGATGGCANAALVLALKAGYHCHALARTPSKLADMLIEKGVPQSNINTHLEITQGDVLDVDAVKQAVHVKGRPATKILSGIGMLPADAMTFSAKPGQTICEDATNTIMQALRELSFPQKPFFVAISSTSVGRGHSDVPLLFRPFYYLVLGIPRKDKQAMHNIIAEAEEQGNTIGGYAVVKPSMLTDSTSVGISGIRSGTEDAPAVGYTISREDVGLWIWEELLKGDASTWKNQRPTITY
ncbi:hypothetical protein MMC10_000273 [Thelotrema lepadinum]|nr:hypothetical protein [Thelotrema lepadinum]